jgi:hypothetical protein
MEKSNSSTRSNSLLSPLRVTLSGTLIIAAAALSFAAVKVSSPHPSVDPGRQARTFNKFSEDLDELLANKIARPGISRDKGPLGAALQKHQLRAYPATDISPDVTRNAIASFKKFKSQYPALSTSVNAPATPGAWQLIGPSSAVFPPILTFSGAKFVTSGRITALAIAPTCVTGNCVVYVGAAGGGVWKSNDALATTPAWIFLSDSFGTNAIGSLLLDPANPNIVYAGTGEPNASGDSEAGVGIYKSTNGGSSWALVAGSDIFFQRAIGQMAFDKDGNLLVPIASAVRGVSSVTSGASSSGSTDHALIPRGLYRQTGATFTRIFTAPAPTRGSTTVKRDPTHPDIIYVNAFGGNAAGPGVSGGIWRSVNNGTSFTQIFAPRDDTTNTFNAALERDEFDVTALGSGATRMYVGAGTGGEAFDPPSPQATFWRSDDVSSAVIAPFASFGGAQVLDYCTGQCWYDNLVIAPAGHPDTVYLAGSFVYAELNGVSNARGVLLSQDGGVTWTDQTRDATTGAPPAGSCCNSTAVAGNSIHPDQHALVVNPNNPLQFFEGSDGGLVRSTGSLSSISSQCGARGLTGDAKTFCEGLLSAVPSHIFSLNNGLSTLQFQSLSVDPTNAAHVQGGTQDNGTFENTGPSTTWPQIIYGDGGQSGFSSLTSSLRFNTFTGQANDANFQNGNPAKWVIISAPIVNSPESAYFYPPVIADPHPANPGTIFQGSFSVWRTQDWGGNQAILEANCAEFTNPFNKPGCGDFVRIGNGSKADLTSKVWGDRVGGAVAWLQRTRQNTGTLWAATGTGRVFVSDNANAAAGSVGWTRLEKKHTIDPPRAISAIYVDPSNPHHAWISYNGYNSNTPATPGHVFDVLYNNTGSGAAATWTDLSYDLPDFPITALVRDDLTGDLYAGSDFTVMRLASGSTHWTMAGTGLPMVEVPGLTIVPSARVLYAATHGRSAWSLALPPAVP